MDIDHAPPSRFARVGKRLWPHIVPTLSRAGWKSALREFVLIVAGVLAALAAQAWWEQREERGRERDYLQRMAGELARDSADLQNVRIPGTEEKLRALAAVAPYVARRDTTVRDTLALLRDLAVAGRFGIAAIGLSNGTFRDLESTGNLRLIQNSALRDRIVSHYTMAELETQRAAPRLSGYAMYFSGLVPGQLFAGEVTLDVLRPYDIARVLRRVRTEEVRDMLNQEVSYGLFLRSRNRTEAERVNALLADIRAALRGT